MRRYLKLDKIQDLSREIDYKDLYYDFTTKASGSINFIGYNDPFTLFKKIRDGDTLLEMAEEDQKKIQKRVWSNKIKKSRP